MQSAAIVLAAGAGTRMKSKKPKVAHEVMGKPLVHWVLDAARAAGIDRSVIVVGHEKEQVTPLVEGRGQIVEQPERKGTGDAVNVCRHLFEGFEGSIVVLSGDCPLITADTIHELVRSREKSGAAVVVLTMELADPTGYGRIIRSTTGQVDRIVEQKDATPLEAAVTECNSGFYCFDAQVLFEALGQVGNNNAQGEYYLTDVLAICRTMGRAVLAFPAKDPTECLGVNSRAQLAEATKVAQRRINAAHMAEGVTMMDPDQVWIGPDVRIARDVELLPQTFLTGTTSVGEDSVIGPNTRLNNTVVGCGCVVEEAVAEDARIPDGTEVRHPRTTEW